MAIKTKGTARLARFREYISWYSNLSATEMEDADKKINEALRNVRELSGEQKVPIKNRVSDQFTIWESSPFRFSEQEKTRLQNEACRKRLSENISVLNRFADVADEYTQQPNVGLWVDGVFAYLYLGNPEKGVIVYEPEHWLQYVEPIDFSTTSPAELLEASGISSLSPANSLIPADSSNITPAQLSGLVEDKTSALSDLQKEIDAVKNAETDELASIKKIIREQQQLLEQRQREMMAELEAKKAEMEQTKEKLESQIWLLDSEIYAIRCYTGETISFTKIRSGKNASDTEPIIIQQKLRFLDEDLGRITSLYRISWENINVFEDFLRYSPAATEVFAPNDRGVSLCRVSRDGKVFSRNRMFPFSNLLEDFEYYHGNTVGIIIRNGENLYLGWTDNTRINIQDDLIRSKANPFDLTFLAKPENFTSKYEEMKWENERKKKTKQTAKDIVSRLFIMNILQGVIERTDMLPLPKGEKVTQESKYIQYALSDLWLTDNRFGSFTDIVSKCNSRIKQGNIILTTQSLWPDRLSYSYRRNDRGRGYADRTHDCMVADCTLYKVNLIEKTPETMFHGESTRIFVSVEKEMSCSGARSNFEVYLDELIDLTYMNSVWLKWVINNKTLGGWRVGGRQVNYAYAIRYLNTALEYIQLRETNEKAFIDAVDPNICKDAEWSLKLSEWKLENGVREINEYQAKRFCKSLAK